MPAGALVAQYMQTMVEFPPRQSPDSWSPEAMMEKLKKNAEALKAAAHAGRDKLAAAFARTYARKLPCIGFFSMRRE